MIESLNKELRFGGEKHGKILEAVRSRRIYSESKLNEETTRFDEIDKNTKAYIPTKDVDALRKKKRRFEGEMDFVTLEVPYHFAILSSLHTYITSVFLARTPVYQFTGRHGETQDQIQALEAIMDYQLRAGSHLPIHYNWLWDGAKYSYGIVGEYWDREVKVVSSIQEEETRVFGFPTGKKKKIRTVRKEVGFEGNRLFVVPVRDFYPDPRVALYNFQQGEYCGRRTSVGLSFLQGEAVKGRYFNVDVLVKTGGKKEELDALVGTFTSSSSFDSGILNLPDDQGAGQMGAAPGKQFIELHEMYIKISPRAWGLGKSAATEIWVFTVANDRVVIGARPLGLYHNRFPFSVLETGFGEEFLKFSTVDMIRPLADSLSWLFNTHMYNVRKVLNDVRVVDPSLIVMKDLAVPQPGGVIRLKPSAYGNTAPERAIHQLKIGTVTNQHLADMQVVEQLIQRTSGVVDNIMGLTNQGGRKTATEVRTASGFSINRIKTIAEYMSATGFSTLGERMVSNTQQLMEAERKYAIAGNTLEDAGRGFVEVNPAEIAGAYDFVQVDGTLPVDRLAQANFWKELIVQLARSPVAQQWDFGKMLVYVMSLQGERNAERFKIQVNQPGQLEQQAAAGNVVPLSEVANVGGNAGTSGGVI